MTNSSNQVFWKCQVIENEILLSKVNTALVTKYFVPTLVYCFILLFTGAIGNALVFYVYLKWRRSPSRIFIIALAGFDLVNCFFTVPTEIIMVFNTLQLPSVILCKISRFLTFTMNNASSCVLFGIAMDRFMRIYKPLHPPLCNKKTKRVILISVILAVLVGWPSLLIYGSQTVDIPLTNTTCLRGHMCLIDDQYTDTEYPMMFNCVLAIGTIIVDIVMITAYAYIGSQSIKAIRETQHFFPKFAYSINDSMDFSMDLSHYGDTHTEHPNMPLKPLDKSDHEIDGSESKNDTLSRRGSNTTILSSKRNNSKHSRGVIFAQSEAHGRKKMLKSTFMLFLVTMLFIFSFIPYCTLVFIRYTQEDYYTNLSPTGKSVYNVFIRSYMLSSALNPVIYSFLSSKFRKQCKKFIKKVLCIVKFNDM